MVLFFPKSKRNISIESASDLIGILNKSDIKTVAVTVSPSVEQLKLIEAAGFDYIQIHGEMLPEVYDEAVIPIIRAINIKAEDDTIRQEVKTCSSLEKIYGILLDAGVPGSGKIFDWNSIDGLELGSKKLFLAGGLTSENVSMAVRTVHPDVVDVSSGVEYDDPDKKGKDGKKVYTFINNLRKEVL